ncbi:pilus assembly protein CpaB [Microterricola gilva]|uniref:Pilus assembly protein CpaB n=1 Tax=Microterricola gilva TaxID=393267 RepID=A0A4V2GB39_9MICO|nr:Flp pilus assembly protein CpaB [Microterricola gilva]RZU66666.1 pilus assembly protein CpaB [Microterricola gilva]
MKTRIIGAILAIVLAAAGAVVLIFYVNSADARAADGAALVPVYVVTSEIPVGTPAEEVGEFVTVKNMPALAVVPGGVKKLSQLDGQVSDAALQPGEQLIAARWVDPAALAASGSTDLPDGMQAVTITLPVERAVGGTVTAGDTVGVVVAATAKIHDSSEEILMTKQVFHKMLVLAVQQGTTVLSDTSDENAAAEPVSAVMVTLAGRTPDIEEIVWGQEFGSVWLTLEPESADESGSRVVDGNVVFQ